jgi:hypothetical protein
MKTRTKLFHVIAMLLLLMSVFPAMGVAAKKKPPKPPKTDKKVYFCHRKGKGNGGFVLIHVSKNASKAHLKHGDAHPGEPVPGREGFWFDEACNLIEEVHVVSPAQLVPPEGWAGVACPVGATVLGGGYEFVTPPGLPVGVSQAAKPGVALYPSFPPFAFTPPDEGWVVQNGATEQSLIVFADCLPGSP